MSTENKTPKSSIKKDDIRKILQNLTHSELRIFAEIVKDVQKVGNNASDQIINDLAKKYAKKAKAFASDGGSE